MDDKYPYKVYRGGELILEAMVRANLPEWHKVQIVTMAQLNDIVAV